MLLHVAMQPMEPWTSWKPPSRFHLVWCDSATLFLVRLCKVIYLCMYSATIGEKSDKKLDGWNYLCKLWANIVVNVKRQNLSQCYPTWFERRIVSRRWLNFPCSQWNHWIIEYYILGSNHTASVFNIKYKIPERDKVKAFCIILHSNNFFFFLNHPLLG